MSKKILLAVGCLAAFGLATMGSASAAVTFSVVQNPDYAAGSGTFDIRISTDASDTIEAFDLQLEFLNFVNSPGVTITALDDTAFPQAGGGGRDVIPFAAMEGTTYSGNFGTGAQPTFMPAAAPNSTTALTFSFSGLLPGQSFDVTPNPVQVVGNTFGSQVIPASGTTGTVTAVPEPASFAVCGLIAAGCLGGRRRNRQRAG